MSALTAGRYPTQDEIVKFNKDHQYKTAAEIEHLERCRARAAKVFQDQEEGPIAALASRTIRGIYNRQGFYSALNFMIKAGMVIGCSQEEAEAKLMGVING